MITLTPSMILSVLANVAAAIAPTAFYIVATWYLIKKLRSKD